MKDGSPSLLSRPSHLSVYGYDKKCETEAEQLVQIEPQNVIVFYRNEFQSASTIKISKPLSVEGPLRFQLRTTNRNAYLVSQSSGEMNPGQTTQYINIIIKEQTPLEQCLHDRFKLLVTIPNKPPIQRKFKVIIDYKKEVAKTKDKELGRLEMQSKTSSSAVLTATPSIMGHPLAVAKRSMMKNSHLVNYLLEGGESERINVKEQLDEVVKSVEERRHRLEYLEKEIQKNQSRKRFMLYVALAAILLAFFFGVTLKKAALVGWQMSKHHFFEWQVQQH